MVDQFWDPDLGAFFDTGRDHEQLVARPRDIFDNATPSGTSVAVDTLLRLAIHADEQRFRDIAETVLRSLSEPMSRMPSGFGRLLSALDFDLARHLEVAIVGEPGSDDTRELLEVVREAYRPPGIE